MAIFKLHCSKACTTEKAILYYNNYTNELFDSDMGLLNWDEKFNIKSLDKVSDTKKYPLKPEEAQYYKDLSKIKKFRVKLGFDCNYRCSYCLQDHEISENKELLSSQNFLELLPESIEPEVFEFWGGEPFLYWDVLRPLVEGLRKRFPDVRFYIATNGSLLDYEKNKWLEEMRCGVSISHDGPGQRVRGRDILADPAQKDVIMDLFKRIEISFNPILNAQNQSRKVIDEWFQQNLGTDKFTLGEGSFFTPCVEEHKDLCLATRAEHIKYRRNSLYELREGLFPHMTIGNRKIESLFRLFLQKIPSTSIITSCDNIREFVMCLDLFGNVFTCQNCSYGDVLPNGNNAVIGSLKEPNNIFFNSAVSWQDRSECRACPVLPLCTGNCILTSNEIRALACDAWFSDNISFMVSVIESLTGYLPYYFEGPQEEDRRDIFGVIEGGEEKLIEVDPQRNMEIL